MKIAHWLKFHFPFLLWLIIIFVQSSFPAVELPEIEIFSADKLAHIVVYGLLAALCYISLVHQSRFKLLRENPILFTVLICSVYGITDELHQYFVPNRDAEVYDWLADFAGVVIMAFILRYYLSQRFAFLKRKT